MIISARKGARLMVWAAAAVAVAGCDVGGLLPPLYEGAQPAKLPLTNERVVVRETRPSSLIPGAVGGFFGERARFVEQGDPHNVNRVVYLSGAQVPAELAALDVQLGDTLLISTQYDTTYYSGLALDAVPDWPGHDYVEYPIANHTLIAVARPD